MNNDQLLKILAKNLRNSIQDDFNISLHIMNSHNTKLLLADIIKLISDLQSENNSLKSQLLKG